MNCIRYLPLRAINQAGLVDSVTNLPFDSQSSVTNSAVIVEESRLDILINNAGALYQDRHLSVDGNELVFSINFLGA